MTLIKNIIPKASNKNFYNKFDTYRLINRIDFLFIKKYFVSHLIGINTTL